MSKANTSTPITCTALYCFAKYCILFHINVISDTQTFEEYFYSVLIVNLYKYRLEICNSLI